MQSGNWSQHRLDFRIKDLKFKVVTYSKRWKSLEHRAWPGSRVLAVQYTAAARGVSPALCHLQAALPSSQYWWITCCWSWGCYSLHWSCSYARARFICFSWPINFIHFFSRTFCCCHWCVVWYLVNQEQPVLVVRSQLLHCGADRP